MVADHGRGHARDSHSSIPVTMPWPITTGGVPDLLPMLSRPGLCRETDPELFYPEKGGSTREAKRICRVCDVRPECLQWALDNDEPHGIWGGAERSGAPQDEEVAA